MKDKEQNFKKYYPLIAIVLILIAIIIGVNMNSSSSENSTPIASIQIVDVWTKTSGYTVAECNTVCDGVYNLQAQVNICQGNCMSIFGKPSSALDNYVNEIKDIKTRK